jgi:hypothetical protein
MWLKSVSVLNLLKQVKFNVSVFLGDIVLYSDKINCVPVFRTRLSTYKHFFKFSMREACCAEYSKIYSKLQLAQIFECFHIFSTILSVVQNNFI